MSIEKAKSGGWRAIGRVRVAGKIVERCGIAPTKEEAKQLHEQLKQEIRQGAPKGSLKVHRISTFGEIIDIYKGKRGILSFSHTSKIDFLQRELGHTLVEAFVDRFEMWLRI